MYAQDNILCQFGLINLSSVQQLISQPILIHFWWELYQPAMTVEIAMAIIGAAHSVVDITVAVAGAVPSPAAPIAAERFHKDSKRSVTD